MRDKQIEDLKDYKYGFSTDIESFKAPKGLNEEVIRFISNIKKEPDWLLQWRLKAFERLKVLKEPDWQKPKYPKIDYQDLYYYSAPKSFKEKPKNLEDFFGQQPILNKNSLLRRAILNDKISNFIFSGPPGVGKTTLIEIISFNTRSNLIKLNAVFSSVKELRNEIANAKDRLINSKRKTILFIDEVHRFTAVQQDALLPSIENGTITFIGATTENPFFAVNKAHVSRSRIFTLLPLAENDLQKIIQKVITHYSKQKDSKKVNITQDAISHLIKFSGGDARTLINALEMAIETPAENDSKEININLSIAEDALQKKNIVYD